MCHVFDGGFKGRRISILLKFNFCLSKKNRSCENGYTVGIRGWPSEAELSRLARAERFPSHHHVCESGVVKFIRVSL